MGKLALQHEMGTFRDCSKKILPWNLTEAVLQGDVCFK
jgi:hypothetical protein